MLLDKKFLKKIEGKTLCSCTSRSLFQFLMMASIAIGTGLLFLVMTVAPWAAVCRAYFPSSASGSASRGTASAEPECKAPPHSNPNNIRVNLTDEQWQELQLEGRCYLACVTEQYYQVDYDWAIILYLVGAFKLHAPQLWSWRTWLTFSCVRRNYYWSWLW